MRSLLRIAAVSSVGAFALLMMAPSALAAPTPTGGGPAITVASAVANTPATVTLSGVRRLVERRIRLTAKTATRTPVQVRNRVGSRALSQVARTNRAGTAVLVLPRNAVSVSVRALATPRLNASPWIPVRLPSPHPGQETYLCKVVSDSPDGSRECGTYLNRYLTVTFPDVTAREDSAVTFTEPVLPKAVSFKPELHKHIVGGYKNSPLSPLISRAGPVRFYDQDGGIFWYYNDRYSGSVERQAVRRVYLENSDPLLAKLSDNPGILHG